MATTLLDESIQLAENRFAAKLAITPGIIGISIDADFTTALGTLPNPANRPKVRLFTGNFDLTAPDADDIDELLQGLALGSVEVPLTDEADTNRYSHADFLATGEYLYAILETPVDLAQEVDVLVTVSEL